VRLILLFWTFPGIYQLHAFERPLIFERPRTRWTFRYTPGVIPFLHIDGFTLPTFGIMVACAMLAAFFVLRADFRRRNLRADAEIFIAVPCLAGIVGAKLYHLLESPGEFFADPWHQLFTQFGFAWFGGLIAGFAAYLALARAASTPILEMLDAGSPAAALGYGVGRIGCLLSGDGDYGIPTSLPWGMSFPHGLVPTTGRVHPTPLYELIVSCVIAWWLWRFGARRMSLQANVAPAGSAPAPIRRTGGEVFTAYLILAGIARFLVEFIRINPRSFFGLTNAQVASLVSVLAGLVLWVIIKRRQEA
jgi:phosphatidylglycerol---prolipoprotein diacylglyceryl transferase